MKPQALSFVSQSYYPPFLTTLVNLTTWQRKLLATSLATLILAISANVSIPTYPVPFTLQSVAVLLIGAFLGRKLAVLTLLQYFFVGAMGFPVFANGNGGVAAFISPSAGYLYGFVICAYLAGFAAEKGYDRRFLAGLAMFALAHQIVFIFGVLYLAMYFQISLLEAIKIGYLPFAGVDLLKFIFATFVMVNLWKIRGKSAI